MKDDIKFVLKYYDLFDFPLTLDEIRKWFFQGESRIKDQESGDLLRYLDELIGTGEVETDGEFYFLKSSDGIVKIRKKREVISNKKIEKVRKVVKILKFVPGVRMITLVSNVAYLNADRGADIDLFIVTRIGRIWTVRFWSVVLMMLLNKRPNKKTIQDKICLSYFVDEGNMNLEATKVNEPDVHLIYLISQYRPIYDKGGVWDKFAKENEWIKKYLVNFDFAKGSEGEVEVKNVRQGMCEKFYKKVFEWDEKCSNDSVHFTINNTTCLDSVLWNFGDPASGSENTSTLIAPAHYYSQGGSYSVNLKTYRNGTVNSTSYVVKVKPKPNVSFAVNDSFQCLSGNFFSISCTSSPVAMISMG